MIFLIAVSLILFFSSNLYFREGYMYNCHSELMIPLDTILLSFSQKLHRILCQRLGSLTRNFGSNGIEQNCNKLLPITQNRYGT